MIQMIPSHHNRLDTSSGHKVIPKCGHAMLLDLLLLNLVCSPDVTALSSLNKSFSYEQRRLDAEDQPE